MIRSAITRTAPAALLLLVATSCAPLPYEESYLPADVKPPLLLGAEMAGPTQALITFDEEVRALADGYTASDSVVVSQLQGEGSLVRVALGFPPEPGRQFSLEGAVEDSAGNTTRFIVELHGFNPNPAGLWINELVVEGSGNNPDLVELLVYRAGSLGGMVLFEGTPASHETAYVFPNMDVDAGDFILVHYKPDGTPEEVDETASKAVSGGKNASDNAYDFWVRSGDGLTGTNGTITLAASSSGGILDAVIYTNRSSDSDDGYRGFGSRKVMEQVDEISAAGAWIGDGDVLVPEDAVWSDNSTATRSLNREGDTNGKDDWYTAPTRGATPGDANTRERFVP